MIGILDSGVGGFSVLREIKRLLPHHPVTYVGDSDWCPYGTKSYPDIIARCRLLCDFLIARGAEVIVIACNSATIAAIETLRIEYPLQSFVGMEPGVKPAAQLTQSGIIGVLATEASLQGEKFHRLLSAHAGGLLVKTQPCPRFVELVECGQVEGTEVDDAVRAYTSPLLQAGADVLVLGCTHYPFLKKAIATQVGPEITLVDTGEAVARQTVALARPASRGGLQVFTTGSLDRLQTLFPVLCPDMEATLNKLSL